MENSEKLLSLPVVNAQPNLNLRIPLKLKEVRLPAWAKDCGVDGQILVPIECIGYDSAEAAWKKVDWWAAIFLLMEGWHERLWEATNGVIHSYSCRLKGWDTRVWDHAWVNRIALFLRKWFFVEFPKNEISFGHLPKPKLVLSHDVDAVSKTLPIRLKQSAFNLFNSIRFLAKGRIANSMSYLGNGVRMLLSREDWWVFDRLLEMEEMADIKAVYHFYADPRSKSLKRWLMDPSYDISKPKLRKLLEKIKDKGHEIGLHPTYDCWNDSVLLRRQKELLEENAGVEIKKCRQHWLRFSWRYTWSAQSKAGIQADSTLMFNDRSGFRNSACIKWFPYDEKKGEVHKLQCTSSVIMDSHFYDYQNLSHTDILGNLKEWTDECKIVRGNCSVLWHPHTLSKDYGWQEGLRIILENIQEK